MRLFTILLGCALVVVLASCSGDRSQSNAQSTMQPEDFVRNSEAREDSIKLAEAYRLQARVSNAFSPAFETTPVAEGSMDDAADDPSFWVSPVHPDSSLIFGTNKKGGIYAYDLQGREKAYYTLGAINNVDVRSGIKVGHQTMDVIGGSNRTNNGIVLLQIMSDGTLKDLLPSPFLIDTTVVNEVYGFCMYRDSDQKGYAIVNGKNGQINSYLLQEGEGAMAPMLHASWKLDTQPEGMVADDQNGMLFIGEEQRGIWKVSLVAPGTPTLIEDSQQANNGMIAYDIEGLAIYRNQQHGTAGFLLASIQGNFTYAVFELTGDHRYLTSFKITDSASVDGVEETDGLEIYPYRLNDTFPHGILIVQDGFNYDDGVLNSQNFKVLDLGPILELINPNI